MCLLVGVPRCRDAGGDEALRQDRGDIADPEAKANRIAWRICEHSCSDVKWVWIVRVNIVQRIRSRRMSYSKYVLIELLRHESMVLKINELRRTCGRCWRVSNSSVRNLSETDEVDCDEILHEWRRHQIEQQCRS